MTIDLPAVERQQRLLLYIEQQQRITVNQIVAKFDVSLATARRDLETLADQGKVQRVHGGAIALRQAPPEPPVLQRASEQSSEKVRIGQAAADLIDNGETIFLSSGTTVLEVARRLRASDKRGLTSVPIIAVTANALKGDAEKALDAGCDVYMSKPINIRELWARAEAFLPSSV